MATEKTYSLKKAITYSLVVSLGFTLLTYLLSLTLAGFKPLCYRMQAHRGTIGSSPISNFGPPLPCGRSTLGIRGWCGG